MLYKYAVHSDRAQAADRTGRGLRLDRRSRPRWGPGRDAPMNLTKFNFLGLSATTASTTRTFRRSGIWTCARMQAVAYWPEDDYSPEADFAKLGIEPSRLMLMNLAGDTTSFRSVLIDSALGLQAQNTRVFPQTDAGHRGLAARAAAAASIPLPIDAGLAARGDAALRAALRGVPRDRPRQPHGHGGSRSRRSAPIRCAPQSWTLEAANGANKKVLAVRHPAHADEQAGRTWLHRGATRRALAARPLSAQRLRADRPRAARARRHAGRRVFYRGYDVLDRNTWASSRAAVCGRRRPPPTGCPAVPVQSRLHAGRSGLALRCHGARQRQRRPPLRHGSRPQPTRRRLSST